jgi:hypothetical protein
MEVQELDEDWDVLASFFPANWRETAVRTRALKGLRKDKSVEDLLRTLLIHLGCGYSLRETVVRAREAGLADISDVALMKRLKKSGPWLHQLCVDLFSRRLENPVHKGAGEFRLFDATTIREPGKTGSLWRIHYSVRFPSLVCDHFCITETEGLDTGESFEQFPIEAGDLILADRGYCNFNGIEYVDARGGRITVRVAPQNIRILCLDREEPFPLRKRLISVKRAGHVASWDVRLVSRTRTNVAVQGRLCVVRKSREAIDRAHKKLRRLASKNGTKTKPETLKYAEYVILFTTFPVQEYTPLEVSEAYRLRWQVELVFKRFKQVAHLGHLPKHDADSTRAWLYGKLFVALLTETLMEQAKSFSPWGYDLANIAAQKSLA